MWVFLAVLGMLSIAVLYMLARNVRRVADEINLLRRGGAGEVDDEGE